jgi:hypothetical protein
MSRRKRLERLESLRRDDFVPPPDMSGWHAQMDATCDANEAGRPCSIVPSHGLPQPPAPPDDLCLRMLDGLRRNLDADPDVQEERAERERRRQAVLQAIEKEQAARVARSAIFLTAS